MIGGDLTPVRFVLLSLVVLGAGGCAKRGVDAVKEMRARACAGDAAGFFNHVDRQEIIRTAIAEATRKAELSIAKLDPVAQAAARESFHKRVEPTIPTVFNDAFTEWEYDIKRGTASDLCRLSITESSEVDDMADVHVRTPAERRWTMARHGDRWSLVRIGD